MESMTRRLLDEYRRADFTKRLHLYLQYPELRAEFTEMDRRGLQPETRKRALGSECRAGIPERSIFRRRFRSAVPYAPHLP